MKLSAVLAFVVVLGFVGCTGSQTAKQGNIERGWIDRSVLAKPEHRDFSVRYDTVTIDPRMISMLRTLEDDADYIVVLGTWCPDSKREVPRFLKAADSAGIPASRIRLYGVDRQKKGPDAAPETYNIERVPTFIVLKGGKEIGRVVESPTTTIEGDIVGILARSGQ